MEESYDIEQMNTNRNIFFMSLPIFVELLLQLLVGNVDQVMVSRISQNSVAAIVNANQIMHLIIVLLTMTSTAVTILLSRYLGAEDKDNVVRTCMVSFLLIGIISSVSSVMVFAGYPSLLRALHVPEEIFDETSHYLLIVGAFILVQGLYLVLSAMLRAFACVREVMMVSVIMNILNIAGNALLINGWLGFPRLGAVGAAISTDFSKLAGLVLMFCLFRKKTGISVSLRYFRPFPVKILKKLCLLAVPSGIESISYNLSQMCILGIINSFGTMATVTKGYCSIFANVDYVYAVAVSSASQIVLGYLIGARQIELIHKRIIATTKVALAVCVGMAILLCCCGNFIFLIFTDNPEIISLGRRILFLEIFLEIGRALNIVMAKGLIALGDVITPTSVGILSQWGVSLVGSWFLGVVLGWGLEGVWIAMAADECLRGVVFTLQYRRGTWKKHFQTEN